MMPRTADQSLEAKIVKAAHRLWRLHGSTSLTLRAVAVAAGTTTTTVYKRFRNKEALLLALAELVQIRITERTTSAPTIEESYRRFLKFADQHPHEYRLLWGPAWSELLGPGRPRPIKDWLLDKFAARFGGKPKDYVLSYYALFLLVHGTASLLIVTRNRRTKAEIIGSCLAICDALVANTEVLRSKPVTRNAVLQSGPAARPSAPDNNQRKFPLRRKTNRQSP
jgi:AcrR family transcriptional regulator